MKAAAPGLASRPFLSVTVTKGRRWVAAVEGRFAKAACLNGLGGNTGNVGDRDDARRGVRAARLLGRLDRTTAALGRATPRAAAGAAATGTVAVAALLRAAHVPPGLLTALDAGRAHLVKAGGGSADDRRRGDDGEGAHGRSSWLIPVKVPEWKK